MSHSQFGLLRTRRFFPLFVTQALGALNDNIFKNALMLMLLFSASSQMAIDSNLLMNIAAGLFILPFFLFSASAGILADGIEKSALIRKIKFFEIVLMLMAAVCFYFAWYPALIGLLFLMGTQSAMFGPVKYSILPQLLEPDELVGGNALIEMATFLAILAGTILGGYFSGLDNAAIVVSAVVVVIAFAGYLSSRGIPEALPEKSLTSFSFRPVSQTIQVIKAGRRYRPVFLAIMAISWFWFLGAGYLTQLPNFTREYLGGNNSVVTSLLIAFSVGVALGSLFCERLSDKKVELGIVPLGSLGMTIFGVDLFFAGQSVIPGELSSLAYFMEQGAFSRLLVDLLFIGFFGGFFIVPLYAFIQKRAESSQRAQVIAANNIFNALFMVLSALSAMLFFSVMDLTITQYFFCLAIMNIAVAGYVFYQLPEFVLRFVIWILTHTLYRVTHKDLDKIPDEGAALLVCNHVSYVDALLMAGAIRRPVRFVMEKSIFEIPFLNQVFKIAGTIPICAYRKSPETVEKAFESIDQALQEGELVCIFPEGKLTRTGEINEFKGGMDRILKSNDVPVVPMALQGLWGSIFSHEGKGAFTRSKRRFWSKVNIICGDLRRGDNATSEACELEVRKLRGSYQ